MKVLLECSNGKWSSGLNTCMCTYCKIHKQNESVPKSDDAVVLTKLGHKYKRYKLAIGTQRFVKNMETKVSFVKKVCKKYE